jgi:tetratricopeptide (TPR) repeat protein
MAGRYEEAIATWKQMYERALRGEFPPLYVHERLARNYARLDRMEEARVHVGEILKIKPDYSVEFFRKRNHYHYKDRAYPEGLVDLLINPMPPGLYYHHLGTAYYHSGRYEEAIAAFKKTLQLAANHQWANLGLAATYSLMGREDEARAAAAEALRINPQFTIEGLAKKLPYKNPEDIDRTVNAFRKAGLK